MVVEFSRWGDTLLYHTDAGKGKSLWSFAVYHALSRECRVVFFVIRVFDPQLESSIDVGLG